MITVHHLEKSRSHRVLWLLEELGAEYEVKRYARDKTTSLAPPELKNIHPLGKAPVIEDDGRVYAETGAAFEHLLDRFDDGALRPAPGSPAFDHYRYWLHAAEGSYMPSLIIALLLRRMEAAPMPFFARPIARRLVSGVREGYLDHTMKALFGFLETTLEEKAWLAGPEFTAADVMMSFPMEAFAARGDIKAYPNIAAALERGKARPAFARAVERGGPHDIMR